MMKVVKKTSRMAMLMVSVMLLAAFIFARCGSINAEIVDAAPDANEPRIVEATAPVEPFTPPVHDKRTAPELGEADIIIEEKEEDIVPESLETEMEESPDAVRPIESTLVELDADFNLYTNLTLGFEIKIPKQMGLFNGDCYFNEEHNSYRPKFALVDTAIFEDGNSTFFSYAQYAALQGDKVTELDGGGQRTDFSECTTIATTLEMMKNEEIMLQWWEIKVTEVADEAALLDLVKAEYGSGCELSEMAATLQEGTFDLDIVSDGKDFSESTCPVNYGVVIRYAPELGKVAIWNTGQAAVFIADETYTVFHDREARDSFRFNP